MGEFADKVFEVVCQIPRGKVATYGQVAGLVGHPRSARYVGFALRSNPRPGIEMDSIPCHRVVFKDGSLCKGFAFGGPGVQYRMLADEGVAFVAGDGSSVGEARGAIDVDDVRVDMTTCQWDGNISCVNADDERGPYPTAPPEDFDWAAEMGEL